MNKPEGFDNINVGAGIAPGGHKCIIKKVEETKSSTGKDMIIVYFDTHKDDIQPNFYSEKYFADQKAGKDPVWKGRSWIVTEGDYGPANLKRFTTAVEDSNPGFEVQWGNKFASCFTDKLVGVVFRMEEFLLDDGQIAASAKPFRFCAFDKALEQKIPDRKNLPEPKPTLQQTYEQNSWSGQLQEGFMAIPDDLNDEGLPFGNS